LDVEIPWEHEGRSALDGGSGDPDEVGMYLGHSSGGPRGVGNYRTLPRDVGTELMLRRTAATLAPPGDGVTGSDRIYHAKPRPDLWGKPVPDAATSVDVDIEDFSDASDVDPDASVIPAKFVAFTSDVEVGTTVGVSVNGTIWATTLVTASGDAGRVDAMIPPEAF